MPSQPSLRRALAAGMAELQAEFRLALPVDEIADALPGRDLIVGVNARDSRA